MKWKVKFQSLEGWFLYGPTFDTEQQAIAFAIDTANTCAGIVDFTAVRHRG